MSPRARMSVLVGAVALAAAGVAVGATLLQSDDDRAAAPTRRPPCDRPPPLLLDLGLRDDAQAVAIQRAAAAHERGRAGGDRERARELFAGLTSVDGRVGAAMAAWPDGTISQLEALSRRRPGSALVRLHLGLALYCAGRSGAADAAWRAAKRAEPDTLSAVRADDFLHPNTVPGRPIFVAGFGPPPSIARLPPREQVAALARAARPRDAVRAKLLYGTALQRLGRPLSAERQYRAAAAAALASASAQVAAAVGRFDKDDPSRAFSRLGPLTRRFPKAATVRFHLGLLLLWLERVPEALDQLRRARATSPSSPLGREAGRYLRRLADNGE